VPKPRTSHARERKGGNAGNIFPQRSGARGGEFAQIGCQLAG